MASVAQFNLNSSLVVDCNSATLSLLEYNPKPPNKLGGRYDLITPIADEFSIIAKATTLDGVANALGTLERYLFQASQNPANALTFLWKPDTLTNTATVNVHEGSLKRDGRTDKTDDGKYFQRAVVEIVRDPIWYGSLTSITFDASTPGTVDNDDTNYVVLPTLLGDLPAACRFIVQSTGGNTASAKRVLASLKANGTPAQFTQILQVENANYLDAALTNQSSTNYSPGSGGVTAKRYAAANTTFKQLARWDITTNLASIQGTYLALLRVRENSTTANYRFRLRGGDIVGSQYLAGAWTTAQKIKCPIPNAADTTEWLLIPLGTITLPRASGRNLPNGGVFIDLWGDCLAAVGSVDLDNLFLFPIGECGSGLGLVAADFDTTLANGRAAFDSRSGQPLAYLSDGTNYLASAASYPQGGPLYLLPQVALQRVYFLVTRDEAGYFKHDRTNVLSVTAHYVPRWAHMAGTN